MRKLLLVLALLPTIVFSQNSWINIQLLTDDYPEETSWTITPPGGSPIIAQSDSIMQDQTLYDTIINLGGTIIVNLYDQYGDGLGGFNGSPQGLWYVSPDQLREVIELTLKENIQIHTHTNGDQATELVLDTLENALLKHPSNDHRFTLQHCQLANSSQFRRMEKLGLCVNLFANHLYYWGEEHYGKTVGPERAERMNSCKTALDNNVPLAIHSDAPVTPLGPLFTAWCAINRQTISGRILGESERISIDQALRAITLGAAYTLKLDSEIGSIEVGKKADFAVLEDDPYDVSPENIKDIKVWGTVQSGRIFSAENI